MQIRECTDKSAWEKRLISQGCAEFLQSWEWGEFQRAVGHEPLRLEIGETGSLQGFIHRLPLGFRYVYFPRVLSDDVWGQMGDFLKEKGIVFARGEQVHTVATPTGSIAITPRQPQHTSMLDLSKTEEELLAGMHSKTRYNIRLAERKGVDIRDDKQIDWFWDVNKETTKRDKFKSHSKAYYEKMLAMPTLHQRTAFFNGKPIASNIYIVWGGRCTYLHGASSNAERNVMAPYLLQWHAIEFAKAQGCTSFDFWGTAPFVPEDAPGVKTCFHNQCWEATHKWTGVTRFKVGFGGSPVSYGTAFELPIRKLSHKLYTLAKKVL